MNPAELVQAALAEGVFPAAQWAYGDLNQIHLGSAGTFTGAPDSVAVTSDSMFDVASLTKVVATTSVAMLLSQMDELDVERPVEDYLPEFVGDGKEHVRVVDLLLHRSGLPAHREIWRMWPEPSEAYAAIPRIPLIRPTGETEYSCIGFIVLAMVLEKILNGGQAVFSFKEFEIFAELSVFTRLNMGHTTFRPGPFSRRSCVITEVFNEPGFREGVAQGFVHDENAFFLGGVSGNAGLFSSAGDLARFAQCLLRGGDELFDPAHIAMWTQREDGSSTRAMGWDTKSAESPSCGAHFSPLSYGHLGFTGCSLWIDPLAQAFGVLLSNRVHPTRENDKIISFRPTFYDAVFEALRPS